MNKWELNIDEMKKAFHQVTRYTPDFPVVKGDELKLAKALISEESKELVDSIDDGYLPDTAKEIIDLLVVTINLARTLGINLEPLWDTVHDSNMAKLGGPKDPVTGKQLKPEGWQKPDMRRALIKQGWLSNDRPKE